MIGTTIHHYKILSKLGKGGMGEVYAALDTKLGRKVALKILPPELSADEERLARFEREAKAIAALNHPNIVTIFSMEESQGIYFLSMELVEGQTLAQLIPENGFDLRELLPMAIAMTEALAVAHDRGIIHRDLKPANIMIATDDRLKLLDFGLAKLLRTENTFESSELETQSKTEAGMVMGTVPYMSPEQLQGLKVDQRSDIFTIGVILYEMATGVRPFQGSSIPVLISAILRDPAKSLSEIKQGSPHAIELIVKRCLEKDRTRRYSSARQLRDDLQQLKFTLDSGEAYATGKDSPRHNLPIQLTSFVGRTQELQDVKRLLQEHRLVTLVGAGGSGKTRLALQTAAELIPEYRDGVWLIDLAPVIDPASVPRAVALVLHVPESPGVPLIDTLCEHLVRRQLLLLLDNCEHLIGASSTLVETLLHSVAGLRVIATSREALNIGAETAWRVPSLSLPDLHSLPSADKLREYEAIGLFLDRAKVHQPKFAFHDQNAETIARICHRLDGVPLAIELAASRVKLLSVDEIFQRLEDRFRLLTGGTRTALRRHQTLRATVDWSHDLLSEAETILFRRLSVFVGGFDLEEAEKVCRDSALSSDEVLDLLSLLVEKSLVNADPQESGTVRYRLLETLRQYGREKLADAGEADAIAKAHLDFFLELAEAGYQGRIEESAFWLGRLETDYDNLRAALNWCASHSPEMELQLAGALGWFWCLHTDHLPEGRERLDKAIKARNAADRLTARALWGATMAANWQVDAFAALTLGKESLQMWRRLGDPMEIGLALEALGWAYFIGNDYPSALEHMEESLEKMKATGNSRLINRASVGVCQVLIAIGNIAAAEPMANEILLRGKELQEPRDIHYSLHFLGDASLYKGDGEEAEVRYGKSLRAALEYGNIAEAAVELQGLAMGLAGQGRKKKAFRLNGAAQAKLQDLGFDISTFQFWSDFKTRYLESQRQSLGKDVATAFELEGKAMGFDAAVSYGLDTNTD